MINTDTVLVLQLQQTLYQVFESNDQEICFEVVSGVLSFDINPAISTTTMDGSAVGNPNPIYSKCFDISLPISFPIQLLAIMWQ